MLTTTIPSIKLTIKAPNRPELNIRILIFFFFIAPYIPKEPTIMISIPTTSIEMIIFYLFVFASPKNSGEDRKFAKESMLINKPLVIVIIAETGKYAFKNRTEKQNYLI